MKLIVPDGFNGVIRDAEGNVYAPTAGAVTIPDELVHDGLYGLGLFAAPVTAPVVQQEAVDKAAAK
jgi:hypothetical protein